MVKVLRGLGLIVPLLVVGAAHGATINFIAPAGLTGSQEVPPKETPALGTGSAQYDDVSLFLTVHLTWSGLLEPPGAAHIHCCPGPGVNAAVLPRVLARSGRVLEVGCRGAAVSRPRWRG